MVVKFGIGCDHRVAGICVTAVGAYNRDMQLYRIEKGVKVPKPSRASGASTPSRAALTMAALAVGESFLIKDALEALKAEKSMRDMSRKDRKFTSRRQAKGGVRIWRIH